MNSETNIKLEEKPQNLSQAYAGLNEEQKELFWSKATPDLKFLVDPKKYVIIALDVLQKQAITSKGKSRLAKINYKIDQYKKFLEKLS